MRKWLTAIKGEHVAFTGQAWCTRAGLQRMVRRLGGTPTSGGEVTGATTVLVRGSSSVWAYGDHGTKERRAAQLIREGRRVVVVNGSEFRKLVELGRPAKVLDRVAGQPTEWLTTPPKRQFGKAAAIDGPLDQEHSVKGRVEQSFLRRRLFSDAEEADCSLCGRRLPLGFLVAGHIKARSECSRRERLDAANVVFGICLLGCDALYERGLIAVDSGGRIRISLAPESRAVRKLLVPYRGRKCTAWKRTNAHYFDWHLTRRFQGK